MEDARGREEEFPWYRYGGMWKVCFFFLLFVFFGGDGEGCFGSEMDWNVMMMFDF